MKNLRFVLLCLALIIVIASTDAFGDDQEADGLVEQEHESNIGNLICGPKCVQEVLRLYDKDDEDIIRLVREIQWPEIRKGATMAGIAQALKKREIHTFAMQINPSARIVWSHPVIVHLNPKPGDEIGHFVVWLPNSKNNRLFVWNGEQGFEEKQERIWSIGSGAVLLTSPDPIDDPGKALKWVGLPFYDQLADILAWGIFVIGFGLIMKSFHLYKLFRKEKML